MLQEAFAKTLDSTPGGPTFLSAIIGFFEGTFLSPDMPGRTDPPEAGKLSCLSPPIRAV